MVPIIATILGIVVLNEELHWYEPVGAVIVLGGVWLAQRKPKVVAEPVEVIAPVEVMERDECRARLASRRARRPAPAGARPRVPTTFVTGRACTSGRQCPLGSGQVPKPDLSALKGATHQDIEPLMFSIAR